MTKTLESKVVAWTALILVIVMICVTFKMRTAWWAFIDIFFAFMMAFMHLMAVYIGKRLPAIGKQLDSAAFVMLVLAVLSFVIEWFAMN